MWESKFYGAFALNRRVDLHAIDATRARWRGDAGPSPLDGAPDALVDLRAGDRLGVLPEPQAEADATTPDAEIPRILMQFAQSLPDRAHDIYQDKDAPIQWNDVADAATIAALQMPDGFDFGSGDVFPSSVSVARSVAAAFVLEARRRG